MREGERGGERDRAGGSERREGREGELDVCEEDGDLLLS